MTFNTSMACEPEIALNLELQRMDDKSIDDEVKIRKWGKFGV